MGLENSKLKASVYSQKVQRTLQRLGLAPMTTTVPTESSGELCPRYTHVLPTNLKQRWAVLKNEFDTEKKTAVELQQKPKVRQTRKFMQPMFDALTDYVNDNTNMLQMLKTLDAATMATNRLIANKTILAKPLLAPGNIGKKGRYHVKLKISSKGGNLLRLYYLLYKDVVPLHFYKAFERDYSQYFKKSDLDLEMMYVDAANPTQKLLVDPQDYDMQIFTNMVTYHVLNEYRNAMYLSRSTPSFEHLRFCGQTLTAPIQQKHFEALFKALRDGQKDLLDDTEERAYRNATLLGFVFGDAVYPNALGGEMKTSYMQKMKRDLVRGRYDMPMYTRSKRVVERMLKSGVHSRRSDIYIDPAPPSTDGSGVNVLNVYGIASSSVSHQDGSNTFATVHRHLNFVEDAPGGETIEKSFTLGRIMLSVVLIFYDRKKDLVLPVRSRGEIIDLAMSYSNDVKNDLTKTLMPLDDVFGTHTLTMFSVQTLIDDLYSMLFLENALPWLDKKYEKRLIRMLFFLWISHTKDTPLSKMRSLLDLDKSIKTVSYASHGMMTTFNLKLSNAATTPEHRQDFLKFIRICDEFRENLRTMYATNDARKDILYRRDDLFDLMRLRQTLPL